MTVEATNDAISTKDIGDYANVVTGEESAAGMYPSNRPTHETGDWVVKGGAPLVRSHRMGNGGTYCLFLQNYDMTRMLYYVSFYFSIDYAFSLHYHFSHHQLNKHAKYSFPSPPLRLLFNSFFCF